MSDTSVRTALRSDAPLVLVEAPAGCGKTHQGADYASEMASASGSGRPLIVTHTHAACSVFADRTKGNSARVDIRTIDSVIGHIASAYHAGLGIPADTAAWVRQNKDGYAKLAAKTATLLGRYPMIAHALARRHPVVICDEHQDSSGDQHAVIMALLAQGARVRIFADPMQAIFSDKTMEGGCPPWEWEDLKASAQSCDQLDYPHRWTKGCPQLGNWTLRARQILKEGGAIDLRSNVPPSVAIVFAENQAQRPGEYHLASDDRKPVDAFEKSQESLLLLTRHNRAGRSFRGLFNRRIPLWEGHTRPGLERLANALISCEGDRCALAAATVTFMQDVGKGFTPSGFGNRFADEVRDGCTKPCKGKPAALQQLARCLVEEPNHRGVANMLRRLSTLRTEDAAFAGIELDHHREFWDAVRLGGCESVDAGLAEITNRRTYARPKPPTKAISTIHKAKGLECGAVILMPCDGKTFPDTSEARCLLYVALSRAMSNLLIVVSRENPSPLLTI